MTDIQWGPAIAVDGNRPGWLGDNLPLKYEHKQIEDKRFVGPVDYAGWSKGDWCCVTAIRLPADHPHYRQTEAEQPTPQADTKPDLTADVTDEQRKAVFALCEAAAALNIATDGFERMRKERGAVVAALSAVRDAGVLLSEPVDPEYARAEKLLTEIWYEEDRFGAIVKFAVEQVARGRALALAGEKEA